MRRSPPAWPFVDVAVDVPVDARTPGGTRTSGPFTYAVPDHLSGRLVAGHAVWVPFGRRRVVGIVTAQRHRSPVERTREVLEPIGDGPVLSPAQVALGRWVAAHYLAPVFESLRAMLPPGALARLEPTFRRTPLAPDAGALTEDEAAVLAAFARARERSARAVGGATHLPPGRLDRALAALVESGLLDRTMRRTSAPVARTERMVRLVPVGPARRTAALASRPSSAMHAAVLAVLEAAGGAAAWEEVRRAARARLVSGASSDSGTSSASDSPPASGRVRRADVRVLEDLEAMGLVVAGDRAAWRDPLVGRDDQAADVPTPTADQARAWSAIEPLVDPRRPTPPADDTWLGRRPRACLVHGVTGSGKTELYLRAIATVVEAGRQAIVLVPEIALTAQTVDRFVRRFPGRVGVWHSELTDGERYDTWRRAREGALDVVVGSRSAVFAPVPRLGLIVVDEEHADAYKQAQTPRYHARDVALRRAAIEDAAAILGSATPAVETYHAARAGRLRLVELPRRVVSGVDGARWSELPPVTVVDMRAELRAGNTSVFSRELDGALAATLAAGEQALLFLNRRGAATFVSCRECGHVQSCPRCRLPLVWHRGAPGRGGAPDGSVSPGHGGALRCHHCNHREAPPMLCPACGSARIRYFGAGTQRIEQEVRARHPAARIVRWDADTTGTRGAHEEILSRFASGTADVLVGTQMIAKGLDLPLVTLVGVVSADTGLNLPDVRARESTFQLLSQVAGRAGRSARGGRVILQTYRPDEPAVQHAARHDYGGFYAREIAWRAEHGYPPFKRLIRLELVADSDRAAEAEARRTAEALRDRVERLGLSGVDVIGPAPAFFRHVRGRARWHVVIRAADPYPALDGVALGRGWRVDVDPISLL